MLTLTHRHNLCCTDQEASVSAVLRRQGELDASSLQAAQEQFDEEPSKKRKLMQLCLGPCARCGQADAANQVWHAVSSRIFKVSGWILHEQIGILLLHPLEAEIFSLGVRGHTLVAS